MEIGRTQEEMVMSICTAALSRVCVRPCRNEGPPSSQRQGPRQVHGPVKMYSSETGKRKDKSTEVHLFA